MCHACLCRGPFGEALEDLQPRVHDRIRVVVGTGRPHIGLAPVPVERLDLVRRRLQHVDRARIDRLRRRAEVDLGDDLTAVVVLVDHQEITLGH